MGGAQPVLGQIDLGLGPESAPCFPKLLLCGNPIGDSSVQVDEPMSLGQHLGLCFGRPVVREAPMRSYDRCPFYRLGRFDRGLQIGRMGGGAAGPEKSYGAPEGLSAAVERR